MGSDGSNGAKKCFLRFGPSIFCEGGRSVAPNFARANHTVVVDFQIERLGVADSVEILSTRGMGRSVCQYPTSQSSVVAYANRRLPRLERRLVEHHTVCLDRCQADVVVPSKRSQIFVGSVEIHPKGRRPAQSEWGPRENIICFFAVPLV